eukprot:Skav227955  [mRNA]  locus=scaffold146:673982:680321:- [translate_table: standard]
MALRGFRRSLRDGTCSRVGARVAQHLADALRVTAAEESEFQLASLCVNELAKKKSAIDFKAPEEVPWSTWQQIMQSSVQIMPRMGSVGAGLPARNLTLMVNALAHLVGKHARDHWEDAAVKSLLKVGGFSAQDLCLSLSALVRISCVHDGLLSRLLHEDCPPLLRDLEARGTAAFAHAAAQLPAVYLPQVARLLQEIRPKIQGFAAEGFYPFEVALTVDALSRMVPVAQAFQDVKNHRSR